MDRASEADGSETEQGRSVGAPGMPSAIFYDDDDLVPRPAITRRPPLTRGKRFRQRLRLRRNRPILSTLVFLVTWQLFSDFYVNRPIFLTGPIQVIQELFDQAQEGTLWSDMTVSATEFLKGFSAGLIVGILLGMALGTSRRFKSYADPIITGFYATPLIALAPLFILWFGIGERKTVVLVFLLVILPVAINTDVGIRATDAVHVELARSFGASRLQLFTAIRFPTSIPFMIAGIRMGIARGLIGVVVGEFFGSREGMGYRILLSSQYFNNAGVLAGVLMFAVAGVILVLIFERFERRVAPWRYEDD
jgi:NitT/TauT family transport system permease protein